MVGAVTSVLPPRRVQRLTPSTMANYLLASCVAGALAATVTELYEPFRLNDNLTIPLFSSLAMQWAFARIHAC